ncbi:MAG: T9SS type A sorting domain-containing protein [Bacteroidota bacterium]
MLTGILPTSSAQTVNWKYFHSDLRVDQLHETRDGGLLIMGIGNGPATFGIQPQLFKFSKDGTLEWHFLQTFTPISPDYAGWQNFIELENGDIIIMKYSRRGFFMRIDAQGNLLHETGDIYLDIGNFVRNGEHFWLAYLSDQTEKFSILKVDMEGNVVDSLPTEISGLISARLQKMSDGTVVAQVSRRSFSDREYLRIGFGADGVEQWRRGWQAVWQGTQALLKEKPKNGFYAYELDWDQIGRITRIEFQILDDSFAVQRSYPLPTSFRSKLAIEGDEMLFWGTENDSTHTHFEEHYLARFQISRGIVGPKQYFPALDSPKVQQVHPLSDNTYALVVDHSIYSNAVDIVHITMPEVESVALPPISPEIHLYPNPASHSTQFRFSSNIPVHNGLLHLYDPAGRRLATHKMGHRTQYHLDTQLLPNGLYLLEYSNAADLRLTTRLHVQH